MVKAIGGHYYVYEYRSVTYDGRHRAEMGTVVFQAGQQGRRRVALLQPEAEADGVVLALNTPLAVDSLLQHI